MIKDFKIDFNLMRNEIQNKLRKFETSIYNKKIDYK